MAESARSRENHGSRGDTAELGDQDTPHPCCSIANIVRQKRSRVCNVRFPSSLNSSRWSDVTRHLVLDPNARHLPTESTLMQAPQGSSAGALPSSRQPQDPIDKHQAGHSLSSSLSGSRERFRGPSGGGGVRPEQRHTCYTRTRTGSTAGHFSVLSPSVRPHSIYRLLVSFNIKPRLSG